jgi:hypothetical protein
MRKHSCNKHSKKDAKLGYEKMWKRRETDRRKVIDSTVEIRGTEVCFGAKKAKGRSRHGRSRVFWHRPSVNELVNWEKWQLPHYIDLPSCREKYRKGSITLSLQRTGTWIDWSELDTSI